MKKPFLLSILLPLLLWSCGNGDERAIRQAAQGYLDAMGNYRIMEAAPFATQETVETTLDFVQNHIMPQADSVESFAAYIRDNTPATIEITQVTLTSDTTADIAFTKTTPAQRQQGHKQLLKRQGQWRVHELIQVPQPLQAAAMPDSLRQRRLDSLAHRPLTLVANPQKQ